MTDSRTDHLATRPLGGSAGSTGPPATPVHGRVVTDTGSSISAEGEVLFCPVRGITAGATQRLERGHQRLLYRRLRIALPTFAVLQAISALRLFFVDPAIAPIYAISALALTGLAAWLWFAPEPGGAALRRLEYAAFAALVASVGISEFAFLDSALATRDRTALAQVLNRIPGIYSVFILGYVILLPGTLRRNLAISAIAIGTAIGVAELTVHRYDLVTAAFPLAARLEYASFALLMMGFAAGLAAFGSHSLDLARRGLEEAGDAGMYRLLGKIGAGGMGEVWKAEHRLLARPAAIKIIRKDLARQAGDLETAQRRFEREARATASLQSPHTVQLYDFGITEEGTFFYVMEYLEGLDFGELVEHFGPVTPERTIYLLRQVAESLGEAHDRGLVHRDIKPGNLHLGHRAGRHDWVRVLDFGLVKQFGTEGEATSTHLTREGTTTGTPAYFPPELAQGSDAADARSDIYALSAVAYWLVTGQLVFDGKGAMDMVVRHIRDAPVPPSQRVEVTIPPALEALILQGLAKNPDDRPGNMREFIDRLDAIEVRPRWDEARAREWWMLHRPLEQDRSVAALAV